MFPTSHDITPDNIDTCLPVLEKVLSVGNQVLIVSKPHTSCVTRICRDLERFRGQITFRFTIGSASNEVLKNWEPGAPPFEERLAALRHAFERGFKTSVSCEPMLDGEIHRVVDAVNPFVTDTIWVGKVNRLIGTLKINGADQALLARGAALIELQRDENILALYQRLKDHPKIRWKDSIKKVVGLERPKEKGLDL